jgi:hypothetical protein
MVFTVVQYMPLDEELLHKTELTKKTASEEAGSEKDSDVDGDDELNGFMASFVSVEWNNFAIKQNIYSYYSHKYRCALINIITPPPEV